MKQTRCLSVDHGEGGECAIHTLNCKPQCAPCIRQEVRARDEMLYRNVQWFQSGLVLQAHRLVYHSTLGLRVMTQKKERTARFRLSGGRRLPSHSLKIARVWQNGEPFSRNNVKSDRSVRLLYRSTLGAQVMKVKKEMTARGCSHSVRFEDFINSQLASSI